MERERNDAQKFRANKQFLWQESMAGWRNKYIQAPHSIMT
jgi:hypothetical protein